MAPATSPAEAHVPRAVLHRTERRDVAAPVAPEDHDAERRVERVGVERRQGLDATGRVLI
jgi:hypothetical protein